MLVYLSFILQFKLEFINLNLGNPSLYLTIFIKNSIVSSGGNKNLILNLIYAYIYLFV